MTKNDYERFAAEMARLCRVFGEQPDDALLDVWWDTMRDDWMIEDFEAAAKHLRATNKFMPRPADFFDLRRAASETAAEAWARVLEHCKGEYRHVPGLDNGGPIDTAVLGLGGYRAIAHHNSGYLHMLQRQFVDRYAEQSEASKTRERVPQISRAGACLPGDALALASGGFVVDPPNQLERDDVQR